MVSEGQKAPDFSTEDVDGNTVSLSSFNGKNLVLYFSNGGGAVCNAQSCSFRDAVADFQSLDASIVAVAAKKKGAATSFRDSNRLTFPVIPDGEGSLQKLFGVPATLGLLPGRVTYVIDKEGIVRKVYNSQMSSSEHIRVAKETLSLLTK